MLSIDTPIKNKKDDLLNRSEFAEELSDAILSYDDESSFNIAIYGEWGTGKTSVINMIEETLIEKTAEFKKAPSIIRFNPWLYSDQIQLTTQFFEQLSASFEKANMSKKIGSKVKLLGDVLGTTSVIPGIGETSKFISEILKVAGKEISGDEKEQNIQKIKNEITEELRKQTIKNIIIIDDIDRLSNNEIRAIFQLVKSIADFPNTIYLLAFDFNIVANALVGVQGQDGAKYLEKIIQVPFMLPKIDEADLTKSFLQKLDKRLGLLDDNEIDNNKLSIVYHKGISPLIGTIRDVVRLDNLLALKIPLFRYELDLVDLLGITAIQIFSPNAYYIIEQNKEVLTGSLALAINETKNNKAIDDFLDSVLNATPPQMQKSIEQILISLFPRISNARKQNQFGVNYSENNSILNGSICNSTYFDKFFSMSMQKEFSNETAKQKIFYADSNTFKKYLIEINAKEQTTLLVQYLESTTAKLNSDDKYFSQFSKVLKVLSRAWPTLKDENEGKSQSLPFIWRYQTICSNILQISTNEEKRFLLIKDIFNDKDITGLIKYHLLNQFMTEHRLFADEEKNNETSGEKSQIITEKHTLMLEKLFLDYAEEEKDNQTLIDNGYFIYLRSYSKRTKNENLLKSLSTYASSILHSDKSLAKVVKQFVGHGTGSSFVVFKIWNINLEDIKEYVNVDEAFDRLSKYVKTNDFASFTYEEKEDIIAFLAFLEAGEETHRESATQPLIDKYVEKNGIKM